MHWNWDHLRFFLALAEHGTLTRAGRSLGVSHTTVLRRVRSFETALGARLFERTASGYRTSDAGRKLMHSASSMRRTLEATARDIGAATHEASGEVVISAPDTIGSQLLPPIVTGLQDRHPGLRLHVRIRNDLVDLYDREADIAIRTGGDPPEGLIGKRLGSVTFVVCAAKSYCEATGIENLSVELGEHRFIELSERFRNARLGRRFAEHIPPGAVRVQVDSLLDAYAFCRAGCGITVLPRYLLGIDDTLQALEDTRESWTNEIWLLSHADLRGLARLQVVRDALARALEPYFADATPD